MHEPVKSRLEEYLRGGGGRFADVEDHLRSCEGCRSKVERMRAQAVMFAGLKAPAAFEVHPGFYARVLDRIETSAKPSPWSLFGESLFAKRLAYASVTLLVLLGTFLVSSTGSGSYAFSQDDPETIMADQNRVPEPLPMNESGREAFLGQLVTYRSGGGTQAGTTAYQDFQ